MKVLREYTIEGFKITEFTQDGRTVSHVVKVPILSELVNKDPLPEEQILYEIKYQTMILEMGGMM